jgi:hypothetical protein
MSTFIHLDSGARDVTQYPNPASFTVNANQVSTWWQAARTVRAYPQEIPNKQYEFVTTIKIDHLVLPYTEQLQDEPIVYVQFNSTKYKDRSLIQTISNMFPTITFVAEWDKTQNDSTATPAWIHYKCNMPQAMRFSRDKPVIFEVTLRDGSTPIIVDNIPPVLPNPAVQVSATFELIPYIRDDEYSNHMVTTLL